MKAELPGACQVERSAVIDPLQYPRWDSLIAAHGESCFFHGTAWAQVLHETYGHQPFYFTRFSEGQLTEFLPVMEVASFWTGRRGVSLPFSDFCLLRKTNGRNQMEMFNSVLEFGRERQWRYFECRDHFAKLSGTIPSMKFYSHSLDLRQETESLFRNFGDSTRRAIRKSERAGLQIEFQSTLESIQTFYTLHCQTRRRHGLPPQPFGFFQNIARHVLQKGQGFVATALFDRRPVAAAVFFHNHRQAIYKFGASDFAFQEMRPNNFVMWKAIKHCVGLGLHELHLGRTSLANDGLRRFKLGFGSHEETVNYFKYDFARQVFVSDMDRAESCVNGFFRRLPLPLLRLAGRILYPHLS